MRLLGALKSPIQSFFFGVELSLTRHGALGVNHVLEPLEHA